MALRLNAEVSLDGSGFERGVSHLVSHGASHFKNLVASAFGVYSIHQALHKTVESAEELVTASRRLDVTVEQLQVMRQAAKESLVEFGRLETALERLNKAREKALMGDAKTMAAFSRLGVSEADLRNKSAAAIFSGPMAERAKTASSQDLTAAGAAIFGVRAFGQLIPILKTDFAELQDKMEHLGSIMSTDAAVATKMLAEEFGLLSNIIAAQIAPGFIVFADKLLWLVGQIQAFGAFLGGFVGSLDMKLSDLLSPKRFGAAVARASIPAGFEAMKALAANEDARAALKDKVKEMADRLKNPPKPEIAAGLTPAEKKTPRAPAPSSDALLAVGNFLGAGRGLITSIAERQLDVAMQHLRESQKQTAQNDEIIDAIESLDTEGIEVP